MATTSTLTPPVKLEAFDSALDFDGLLYDYSVNHTLTGALRAQRRSPMRLEGQSCSTLYAKRLTSHRSHRPRPQRLPMSRASTSAVVPRARREPAAVPPGPPKDHYPDPGTGRYTDIVHLFWTGEVLGNVVQDNKQVLQMTTWKPAMDLICDRAREDKLWKKLDPGPNQCLQTKCRCPQHIANLRELAQDWLARGSKTRTGPAPPRNAPPPPETQNQLIIAQLCKWYLYRSEFSTLADEGARRAAFHARANPRLQAAFQNIGRDRVEFALSPYFAPTREPECMLLIPSTVALEPGMGVVRAHRSSNATGHPYATASRPPTQVSRPIQVKAEPRDDDERALTLYQRVHPQGHHASPRIKKEEDCYP
ncbi:hypothetical protein PENSPDRAFT_756254 [Peniophora sp. CONT]|nr:hypothetical protein PENSPDRAFT_756254 [Peniophora sp. CONT]